MAALETQRIWNHSTMKIYGITGRKGSGKDTAGEFFIKAGFIRVKFADAVKGMLRIMLVTAGYSYEEAKELIDGSRKEEPLHLLEGKTMRWAMQSLGTEWGREMISENLWVNITEGRCRALRDKIIITDMRFPNEAGMILRLGGQTIRIVRDSVMCDATHDSERFIDDLKVDWVITNNGTIDDLHLKLLPLL